VAVAVTTGVEALVDGADGSPAAGEPAETAVVGMTGAAAAGAAEAAGSCERASIARVSTVRTSATDVRGWASMDLLSLSRGPRWRRRRLTDRDEEAYAAE
jgi:hypothetical protein